MIKIPQKPENLKITFKNDKRKIKFKEYKRTNNYIPGFYWPIIEEYLEELDLLFMRNVGCKHLDKLRFMYYIPSCNLVIDYNDTKIKYTENSKIHFCRDNNINRLGVSHKNIFTLKEQIESYV